VRVELGLFEEDNLLFQGEINVTDTEYQEENELVKLKHQLINDEAIIELRIFNEDEQIVISTLNMPVHESEDWESIEMASYTLAFKCKLNA
jgi:hypothetical protein